MVLIPESDQIKLAKAYEQIPHSKLCFSSDTFLSKIIDAECWRDYG